jgi:Protein of unknown function (DUF1592)/Protein of unknown function (DUF1588)/Protein of unknown function (DUF1587)/Protein of unknown function (DUF1585)/Protein of unknown function (DUF1595)/Planctomycete cytochrome C
MFRISRPLPLVFAALLLARGPAGHAADFARQIRPTLREYCLGCHSTEKHKGDLDLERFTTAEAARQNPRIWQSVVEQVSLGEMPPKDKPQPTPARREQLLGWANGVLDDFARAHAGDPGPVVLRRLSNAEYTYTVRDLTGVGSLNPAKEFPADSASGEGFMNVGNSLVMSPSLVTKYLDAGKEIANRAMLLPDGIAFSPSTSARDWAEEKLAAIRAFYARFTENGGGSAVNLQGIKFDTKDGGVLPLRKYLAATIANRIALKSGKASVTEVARAQGLNAKYLGTLWTALNNTHPSPVLDGIRAQWRAAKPADADALTENIAQWQRALWRFTQVGHIGKRDGPKAWQVPVTPLANALEVRLKLPAPAAGADGVILYLTASDAGDGNTNDFAVWENPRLVAPGRPDLSLRDVRAAVAALVGQRQPQNSTLLAKTNWGLDPALFGKHPNGAKVGDSSLCIRAPSVIEVRLPAELAAGCEFVATGTLHKESGTEGSVQMQVLTAKPSTAPGLTAGLAREQGGKNTWSDGERPVVSDSPIIVVDGSAARRRFEAALDEFRQLFPAALCYTKIVPVDEVVTLTLYYREDDHLRRLMLDDAQAAEIDRLWAELHYVSQDPLKLVDAFEQLWQFATQDADPSAFTPMREPIKQHAEEFRKLLVKTQPAHLDAVLKFAENAYRRPLTDTEKGELRELYRKLRAEDLPHERAIRLTLARVLVAPAFLYRAEQPGTGRKAAPVNDWELATRLSYFLWSSAPDAELRALAAGGTLHQPAVLAAQTRRMLRDARARRLATEFACAWLHVYDFDELGEKSDRHFPTFAGLRGAMYEETIRFFTDFFQHDGSVLNIINADYTFLNADLAQHYGITDVKFAGTNDWRRVDGVKRFSRGGILAQATTLAKQSGASRTSPILRGNWLCETLLGEKLPRPPKDVPRLPEDEATEALTVRQLTEKHTSDPKCYGCHRRIDAYGYSLEAFDAIGRHRDRDLGGRPIDTHAKVLDGSEFDGLDGLRHYLLTTRHDAFLRQFCRKLLGYSLGRSVLLSDGPLIAEMQAQLKKHGYRISAAIETIVRSPQFREIRGREMAFEE